MTLSVTSNAADVRIFLVHFAGSLQQRRKLNQLLADRLCEELKVYFQSRSGEPNKMGAPSSGFWNSQAAATGVLEVSDAAMCRISAIRSFFEALDVDFMISDGVAMACLNVQTTEKQRKGKGLALPRLSAPFRPMRLGITRNSC